LHSSPHSCVFGIVYNRKEILKASHPEGGFCPPLLLTAWPHVASFVTVMLSCVGNKVTFHKTRGRISRLLASTTWIAKWGLPSLDHPSLGSAPMVSVTSGSRIPQGKRGWGVNQPCPALLQLHRCFFFRKTGLD
jgi:hypothetical protein